MDRTLRLAAYSLLLGLLILGLKAGAYLLTGSVALYSDALESIINVVAAGAALLALFVARRPADAEHPYGHAKAEYFSAVLEGVLIVLAAISIIYRAYQDLHAPRPLEALGLGLLVSLGATLLNAAYGTYLIRAGRQLRSPALVADGQHLMTDVLTSGGVLVALGLVALTGWTVLDPVMAILVALNILWVGSRLVRASLRSLLDEAAPAETQALIRRLVSEHAEGALEAHDLRTRHAGRLLFIDFHLVVPEHFTVGQAHAICDRLEQAIAGEIPGSEVAIHVEPEDAAKHTGVLVL